MGTRARRASIPGHRARARVKRRSVTAWADGWAAVSTSGPSSPCHTRPITSVLLFAVALGVGRVFRAAWGLASGGPIEVRWNTWRHTLEPEAVTHKQQPLPNGPPDLGRVLQVGAGAVGSNIIYFLGLTGASADVVLIDLSCSECRMRAPTKSPRSKQQRAPPNPSPPFESSRFSRNGRSTPRARTAWVTST